jgi:hypothetical protein
MNIPQKTNNVIERIYDTKGMNRSRKSNNADNTRAKSKRTNGHTALETIDRAILSSLTTGCNAGGPEGLAPTIPDVVCVA